MRSNFWASKIRDDVFRGLVPVIGTREDFLRSSVETAYRAFSDVFSSVDEVVNLLNRIKDVRKAELFLDLTRYYSISKNHVNHPFLKAAMIVSLVERMTASQEDFVDFKDWITKGAILEKDFGEGRALSAASLREVIEHKREEYLETYGSVNGFADFLEQYLDLTDIVQLILSVRPRYARYINGYSERVSGAKNYRSLEEAARGENASLGKGLMPLCYDWRKCLIQYGHCVSPLGGWCSLYEHGGERRKRLQQIACTLQGMRSKFVHEAKAFPLGESVSVECGERPIAFDFSIEFFERVFEKAFKRYFEEQTR